MSPNVPIVPRESEYVLFGCKCTDIQSYKHIAIYSYRITMSPSVPRESEYVLLDWENKPQSFKFFHSAIQCNRISHTITNLIFEQTPI